MIENQVTTSHTAGSGFSIRNKVVSIKTLVAFLLGIGILCILVWRLDWQATIEVIETVNTPLYFVAFIVFYISIYLRAVRWGQILRNVNIYKKIGVVWEILFLSWFINVIIPAKLGDFYRSYLMRKDSGSSFSEVLGTIFVERIFDVFMSAGFFLILSMVYFQYISSTPLLRSVTLGSLFLLITVTTLIILMRFGGTFLKKILPSKIKGIYGRFENGTLQSIKKVPLLLILTTFIWLLESLRFLFVTQSVGLQLPFLLIIFVTITSSILTTLPITPAGLGFVELAIVGILLIFNVNESMAVSVAILDRVISYWSVIPIGYVTYIISKKV